MSDGREEREEQEQRRKWEKDRKDADRPLDDPDRGWEREGERERRDSRCAAGWLQVDQAHRADRL